MIVKTDWVPLKFCTLYWFFLSSRISFILVHFYEMIYLAEMIHPIKVPVDFCPNFFLDSILSSVVMFQSFYFFPNLLCHSNCIFTILEIKIWMIYWKVIRLILPQKKQNLKLNTRTRAESDSIYIHSKHWKSGIICLKFWNLDGKYMLLFVIMNYYYKI